MIDDRRLCYCGHEEAAHTPDCERCDNGECDAFLFASEEDDAEPAALSDTMALWFD